MELFYGGVVAEAVRPPSRDEVHAVSLHALEELPSTVSRAGQFGGFGGRVYGGVCRVCRGGDGGDGAKVGTGVEGHSVVRRGRGRRCGVGRIF